MSAMKKCAMVTGALGGIGFATVKELLAKGYGVSAFGRTPADAAAERLSGLGDVLYTRGDLSAADGRQQFVDRTLERYGRIDVLVNVAGVAPESRTDLLEMTEESYDRVMSINTKATLFLTQAVARRMLEQPAEGPIRGYIINISSLSAYTSSTSRGEYCISKAGVSMITALFADRLAEERILVNEVRPGIIATKMTAGVQEKYDPLIKAGLLPIKRWGQPEDVAAAVGALCSGCFDYTTGQSIDVDGGFHMKRL